ncbi:hypothetical protein MNBD_GAMMA02-1605, partial [hydrothermal vent metagenome]
MVFKRKLKDSSILYIEDDAITRKQLSKYFKSECRVLYTAVDGQEGFEHYQKYDPDIVITDIEMPKLNGLEMAKKSGKNRYPLKLSLLPPTKKMSIYCKL